MPETLRLAARVARDAVGAGFAAVFLPAAGRWRLAAAAGWGEDRIGQAADEPADLLPAGSQVVTDPAGRVAIAVSGPLSEQQSDLLRSFATLLAAALPGGRLDLVPLLERASDLPGAMEEMARRLKGHMGCEHLWVLARHGDVLRGPSISPGEPPVIELRLGKGIIGKVAQSGESILVADTALDPRYVAVVSDTRSEVCVPIAIGSSVIGVINAESARPGAFTEDDLRLLSAVAQEVAPHFERLRLRDAAGLHAREQAALLQVAGRILAPMDLQAVLDEILAQVEALFSYPYSAILLVDPGGQELFVKSARGFPPGAGSMRLPLGGRGITVRAAVEGKACYAPDVVRDDQYVQVAPDVRSELALPLLLDSKVIGVLNVESRVPGDFPPEVRTVLEAFATLAALAIHRAQLDADLRRLSLTDSLTGLANHRALLDALGRELFRARRSGQPLSVVLMEIDNFKRINDRLGHLAGDRALKSVARAIKGTCRTMDIAARFGGDEFVLVLPAAGREAAAGVAERVRRAVAALVSEETGLTVSLGVATAPLDGYTAEGLLEAADRAMYRVKRAGGNGIRAAGGKGHWPDIT